MTLAELLTTEQEPKADEKVIKQQRLLDWILSSIHYSKKPDFLPFIADGNIFDVVTNPEELLEAFRLRFVAYGEAGYIRHENYPLRMEFDKYDAVSVHFLARSLETRQLIGYARLILDTQLELHIDDLVDISDYRTNYRICEMSRMISYPKGQPHVNRRIRYSTYMWAQMIGANKIVGISLERDKARFDKILFVPMEPYRTCDFSDETNFQPLISGRMYGNVFHLTQNKEHILSLR